MVALSRPFIAAAISRPETRNADARLTARPQTMVTSSVKASTLPSMLRRAMSNSSSPKAQTASSSVDQKAKTRPTTTAQQCEQHVLAQ